MGNYLRICHCTLEEYIVYNGIVRQRYASTQGTRVAFHVNFQRLRGFLEVLILLPQYLELLPYVFLPFQQIQLLDRDNNFLHPVIWVSRCYNLLYIKLHNKELVRTTLLILFTLEEEIVMNGSLCNASCSLQQNQTSGRHVLHRVDEIVVHKKQGPSINVNGDKERDLLFGSSEKIKLFCDYQHLKISKWNIS